MLSRSAQYAIEGVLRLAALPVDGHCRVEDLVAGTDAPRHGVAKVFHVLAQRGVLRSVRGSGGGFRLAPGALDRNLAEIIEAVEGAAVWSPVMERGLFDKEDDSPLAAVLTPLVQQIDHVMRTTTVRDLLARMKPRPCCCGGCDGCSAPKSEMVTSV